MAAALAASLIDFLAGLALAPAGQVAGNRIALEGLTFGSGQDGALEVGIRKLEAASLRLASGPLVLELGKATLHELAATMRTEEGKPRLHSLAAADAELSGVKVQGPLFFPRQDALRHATDASWSLVPLAAANGTVRAQIVDAHLLFDADVTVPIREGRIDFNDATVEHVGPDSRMGVSRLGIYVDAPNGRSYLYQFPSTPVAGVEYERRGAMLGPWVTHRGTLQLLPFAEGLLRQPAGGQVLAFTEQARQLFDRTAVSGEVRLGDGRIAAPGMHAELAGRADGRNVVRLHSQAVGRGFDADLASLSVREAAWSIGGTQLVLAEATGALTLRAFADGTQWRFAFELSALKISGLRLQVQQPAGG